MDLDEKISGINNSAEDINQNITNVNERVGLMEGKVDLLEKSKYKAPITSKIQARPIKPKGSVSEDKPSKLTNPEDNKGNIKPQEKVEMTSEIEKEEKPVKRFKWFGLGLLFNK